MILHTILATTLHIYKLIHALTCISSIASMGIVCYEVLIDSNGRVLNFIIVKLLSIRNIYCVHAYLSSKTLLMHIVCRTSKEEGL